MPIQIESQPFVFEQSLSAASLSGIHFGDGSNLAGITTALSGTANQISVSKSGSTTTLSLPASTVFPGNVAIAGNLTVAGTATYFNTQNLIVGDNLIYFNDNNYSGNTLDIGIVAHFSQAPLGYNHTGLVRRAGGSVPGVWTLFSGLTAEPLSAANIDWTDKNIRIDSLSANLIGNVTGNADTVTNGVYTNGVYSDPSWITTLSDTKLIGTKFATNTAVNTLTGLLVTNTTFNNYQTTVGTATGTLVTNTTFNNYQTNVGAATATLLPTTTYQNSSGSFATNTTVNTLTGLLVTTITNVTATGSTTISNPAGSYQDGQRLLYRVTQGGSGNNAITLDTQFRIPTSSGSSLPFSTTFGYTDLLGVMYNQPANKWDVISFVPGYY